MYDAVCNVDFAFTSDQAALSIFVTTSAAAIAASAVLFSGSERGVAMVIVAAAYGGLAYLPTLLGRRDRDLSSLLAATALTAALAATGELMHGIRELTENGTIACPLDGGTLAAAGDTLVCALCAAE